MYKQKILILGDGLTGALASSVLSKLDIEIETASFRNNFKNDSTIALSSSNYNYLKKSFYDNEISKIFWPVKKIKIYDLTKNVLELVNFDSFPNHENIIYVGYSHKIQSFLKKQIKYKNLKTKIFSQKKIKKILKYNVPYQLILNCTGNRSWISKDYLKIKKIKKKYNQSAITAIVKHNKIKNNIARQIFCQEGPLAILPISSNKSSLVWSINNYSLLDSNKKIRKQLVYKLRSILSNFFVIKNISKLILRDLNFSLSQKYFFNRVLSLGDSLHTIHPLAGQGFNMTIRDIKILKNILNSKINLGLDLGDATALNEFSEKTKSNNFAFANLVDFLHYLFSKQNKFFKKIRNFTLRRIDEKTTVKKFFVKIADEGLRF